MYEWYGVILGMILYSVVMATTHVLCAWFFYWRHPENKWYSDNYHELPKCLRIFDKH